MKKLAVVCAAVVFLVALLPRSAEAEVTFNFGVRAGVSLSNVSWSDDDGSEKSLLRPTFGILGVINLSRMFSIQPELNYLTTGEWWEDDISVDIWKVVETFNYLQIPVLLKVHLKPGGRVNPFLLAGPVVSFLLSAREKDYLNGDLDDDEDIKEFFKSTDFGAAIGGGAGFMVSSVKVFVDLRYYLGLTNAYSFINKYTMKNRALILSTGVMF